IPENVSAIGLAMQTTGRHADVAVDAVRRDGLQQVEDVQAQDHLRVDVAFEGEIAAIPQVGPRQNMGLQQIAKAACTCDRLGSCYCWLRAGVVTGGEVGDDFFWFELLALIDLKGQRLSDIPIIFLPELTLDPNRVIAAIRASASC